jgi:hypothetical protein
MIQNTAANAYKFWAIVCTPHLRNIINDLIYDFSG